MFSFTKASLFVIELVILCFRVLFGSCSVVSTSAVNCLESGKSCPEVTYYVSSGTLNSTHSLCSVIYRRVIRCFWEAIAMSLQQLQRLPGEVCCVVMIKRVCVVILSVVVYVCANRRER